MKTESNIKCSKAIELMSSYIDCMAEPEESRSLESHLDSCEPCQRQLHSYVSLRSMMASIEPVRPPEDLVMDTRVRLSHARSGSIFDRIESLVVNVLKPVVDSGRIGNCIDGPFVQRPLWSSCDESAGAGSGFFADRHGRTGADHGPDPCFPLPGTAEATGSSHYP